MRKLGFITTSRADYGIIRPILKAAQADSRFEIAVVAAGTHWAPEFGRTAREIEADGFTIAHKVECLVSSDSPEGMAKSAGLGALGFAQLFGSWRPDILVLLGDRIEMFSAGLAALPFLIPMAHVHGGEVSEGAIDDSLRHALTKLSHLHFVSTDDHARRVRQLGEESWRVTVSGAPGLDNLAAFAPMSDAELEAELGLRLDKAPLLVTYHPVTTEADQAEAQMAELLAALPASAPVILTLPNADSGGRAIARLIEEYIRDHANACLVASLGTRAYFTLMTRATAMVGNSSSGIIEAPSFALPVVNIGNRQRGRQRAANVIDSAYGRREIASAIARAVSPDFRRSLKGMTNPYGDGKAAQRIVSVLAEVTLDARLTTKRFADQRSTP